jgi:hypothetical protein
MTSPKGDRAFTDRDSMTNYNLSMGAIITRRSEMTLLITKPQAIHEHVDDEGKPSAGWFQDP